MVLSVPEKDHNGILVLLEKEVTGSPRNTYAMSCILRVCPGGATSSEPVSAEVLFHPAVCHYSSHL